jgi:hypothetical protein
VNPVWRSLLRPQQRLGALSALALRQEWLRERINLRNCAQRLAASPAQRIFVILIAERARQFAGVGQITFKIGNGP